jgi:hypothetical protein
MPVVLLLIVVIKNVLILMMALKEQSTRTIKEARLMVGNIIIYRGDNNDFNSTKRNRVTRYIEQ